MSSLKIARCAMMQEKIVRLGYSQINRKSKFRD